MSQTTPRTTSAEFLAEDLSIRKISRMEKALGPEVYRMLRGIFTNPLSIVGISLIVLFFVIAGLAPVLAPPPTPNYPFIIKQIPRDGFGPTPKQPGSVWSSRPPPLPFWYKALTGKDAWVHIMGTSGGQWDIYYGVIWGVRTALLVGILIEALTLLIGMIVGSLAAFYGGWLDEILMRTTDIFLAFPSLLAALTLSAILTPILGKGIWPPIIALVTFGWMTYARIIRGDILSVRERDYVMAARVIGVKDRRIIMTHVVPNAIYPTLILASLNIGADVIAFAALSFLGIGTEVGYPDWGQLISFARNWIPSLSTYWWILIFPAVALVLFVMGWNLVGDALRDIMDPRMRGRGA